MTSFLWLAAADTRLTSTISSPATIMEPDRYPTGIDYVLVNGRFTVDDGKPTGALPGAVLDRRGKDRTTKQ